MRNSIARNFDRAAHRYDGVADAQAQIADKLIAAVELSNPATILDIGSGTGFAAVAAQRRWPDAALTAIDQSPKMLLAAQQKMPNLHIIPGDAAHITMEQKFDLIVSSMMLHWLPEPLAALQRWRGWLNPGGAMHIAVLTAGSFGEWRDLCQLAKVQDGLWPMLSDDFATAFCAQRAHYNLRIAYSSAHDFLRRLKAIGAATAHPDHAPLSTTFMRQILASAPQPFVTTYSVLSLHISA